MAAKVTLIEGRHITAAQKSLIRGGIEFLRERFAAEADGQSVPDYAGVDLRRKGSPYAFTITPSSQKAGRYTVVFKSMERNDYGAWRERTATVTVDVSGDPLYMPACEGCLL